MSTGLSVYSLLLPGSEAQLVLQLLPPYLSSDVGFYPPPPRQSSCPYFYLRFPPQVPLTLKFSIWEGKAGNEAVWKGLGFWELFCTLHMA